MRTLKGHEALEVAKNFNVLLYDVEHRKDTTYEEAKLCIDKQQNPHTFLLENWPDTHEEAEQVILKEYQKALKSRRVFEASIFDISNNMSGGLPIHLGAAELAAERLVIQNKLEVVSGKSDDTHARVYRIPRTVYFAPAFLEQLRSGLCDECAGLDFAGPFHESCLIHLIEFLKAHDFTLSDMTQGHAVRGVSSSARVIRSKIGVEWLQQKASVTTARLKSALRPVRDQWWSGEEDRSNSSDKAKDMEDHAAAVAAPSMSMPDSRNPISKRTITKADLIRYLNEVEILDNISELTSLKDEREALLERLESKDRDILQAERAKGQVEKQCQEIQRDMDILIQAMRITKRHDPQGAQSHIIDGTYGNEPR